MAKKNGGKSGNAKGKAGGKKNSKKHSGKDAKQQKQVVASKKLSGNPPQHHNSSNHGAGHKKQKPGGAKASGGLSKMQEEMRRRLDGGKFRMLNEQLYTTTGDKAFTTFQSEPDLFDVVCLPFHMLHHAWLALLWNADGFIYVLPAVAMHVL